MEAVLEAPSSEMAQIQTGYDRRCGPPHASPSGSSSPKLYLVNCSNNPHPVQGQAGSQAIEDAAALGVLFSSFNAIDETSISKRLDNFENVRRNRASAMQLLSDTTVNHSDQEAIRKAVQPYMPDQTVPGEYLLDLPLT